MITEIFCKKFWFNNVGEKLSDLLLSIKKFLKTFARICETSSDVDLPFSVIGQYRTNP